MAIYPIGNIYGLYPKGDKAGINIIGTDSLRPLHREFALS
ncbi:MAG: hypothetical protein ACI9CB_000397 [Rhodothermales bacterium]|jgi:hypothetical protein